VSGLATNVGTRAGSEIVKSYVAPVLPRLARTSEELRVFAEVALSPGESAVVDLIVDDRSFASWEHNQDDWSDAQAFVPEIFNFLSRQYRAASAAGRSTLTLRKFSSGVRPMKSHTTAPC